MLKSSFMMSMAKLDEESKLEKLKKKNPETL